MPVKAKSTKSKVKTGMAKKKVAKKKKTK